MTPPRFLAAMALVALLAGAATMLGAGTGGIASLLWAIGVPVAVGRAFDPRKHAWIATSLWLVMCSFAVIVVMGQVLRL